MTRIRQELGDRGEEAAVSLLKNKGMRILERNFRTRYGEIDIIASCQQIMIFVEVKTRSSHSFGLPQEAVEGRKQARLRKLASAYMARLDWQGECRFDVVAVSVRGHKTLVEHFEGAF
ncbi:MAG: YraN family protein [Vulcanimicrobiota bacterium]